VGGCISLHAMLAILALGALGGARDNLCFTAHGKGALRCSEAPTVNAPITVYDSGRSPQRKRTLFLKKGGKVCEDRKCRKCLGTDAESWLPCDKATPFTISVDANSPQSRVRALAFAFALIAVPVAATVLALRRKSASAEASQPTASKQTLAEKLAPLLEFAASWWFPWVAAFGTGANLFTLVFTAATVVIFLAAILARPERWPSTAFANALGATVGTALMLTLIRARGDPLIYLQETYPSVLANPAWQKAMGWMNVYGVPGMLLVASLPIFLHPIIAFGLLAGMSDATILSIVLTGRTFKYLVMAKVTTSAPHLLRFFGIKTEVFDMARSAVKKSD